MERNVEQGIPWREVLLCLLFGYCMYSTMAPMSTVCSLIMDGSTATVDAAISTTSGLIPLFAITLSQGLLASVRPFEVEKERGRAASYFVLIAVAFLVGLLAFVAVYLLRVPITSYTVNAAYVEGVDETFGGLILVIPFSFSISLCLQMLLEQKCRKAFLALVITLTVLPTVLAAVVGIATTSVFAFNLAYGVPLLFAVVLSMLVVAKRSGLSPDDFRMAVRPTLQKLFANFGKGVGVFLLIDLCTVSAIIVPNLAASSPGEWHSLWELTALMAAELPLYKGLSILYRLRPDPATNSVGGADPSTTRRPESRMLSLFGAILVLIEVPLVTQMPEMFQSSAHYAYLVVALSSPVRLVYFYFNYVQAQNGLVRACIMTCLAKTLIGDVVIGFLLYLAGDVWLAPSLLAPIVGIAACVPFIRRTVARHKATNIAPVRASIRSIGWVLATMVLSSLCLTSALFSNAVDEARISLPVIEDSMIHFDHASTVTTTDGSLVLSDLYLPKHEILPSVEDAGSYTAAAAIANEDVRFYEHSGIDFVGTARALASTLLTGEAQGGSTITQQLAKNLLLSNVAELKTVYRKIAELAFARELEAKYSKDEILAAYLSSVNCANGYYGVQSAARYYFGIDAKDMSLAQSATLVAIAQAPSSRNPLTHPDECVKGRNVIIQRMADTGAISQTEAENAIAEDLVLKCVDLYVDNTRQTASLEDEVKMENGQAYLSMSDVERFFDPTAYTESTCSLIVTTGRGHRAEIDLDTLDVTVDEELAGHALMVDGQMYVPLDAVALPYGIDVTVTEEKGQTKVKVVTQSVADERPLSVNFNMNYTNFPAEAASDEEALAVLRSAQSDGDDAQTSDASTATAEKRLVSARSYVSYSAGSLSYDWDPEVFQTYADKCATVGMEAWPIVFYAGSYEQSMDTLSEMVNDYDLRVQTAREIADRVRLTGSRGVVLDFECMLDTDSEAYTRFTKDVKSFLGEGVELAVCVNGPDGSPYCSECYDLVDLSDVADHLVLFAYDQTASDAEPGPNSGCDWVRTTVWKMVERDHVPADKITVSLPLYMNWWRKDPGASSYTLDYLTMVNTSEAMARLGDTVEETWLEDEKQTLISARTPQGAEVLIWLEDEDSLRAKIAACEELGVTDFAFFESGYCDTLTLARLLAGVDGSVT